MSEQLIVALLAAVMGLVLALPLSVKRVEEELEAFLLVMGCLAVTVSGGWSGRLLVEALEEPVRLTAAVLVFGLLFRAVRPRLASAVGGASRALGLPLFSAAVVAGVGLASSVVTAIIAALVLSEVVTALKLPRRLELRIVVACCFSIGLGAALTPIGEPLSTITTSRLAGPPHEAGFFFLARLLWPWLLPGMAALAAWAAWASRSATGTAKGLKEDKAESASDVVLRAARVYLFVAGLVLLGRGMEPLEERWLAAIPPNGLFWANTASAALDNATLAAAEVSPRMDPYHLRAVLLGLLASGGMLIPGNIPNIIAAKKLGIGSREWAREALPVGLVLLTLFFGGLLLSR
jgi:predicted cation transporter